ncbi:MAG: GTPase Era [Candidatus Magasanikbacteria bacterium CG10_big_fil_rev_8_21_14_0_10_36_16]|uniref:GTPase Era n=1 Tax=Candidatus Magasanikbacteria bacterium CG10_big_fil_rev_8_21_14_0_10_36_16 TaxID=1974645 RepID=A0A2H0TYZ5_9BACT|nr:MAG: GTPase Era [Candidatus Magasanikbacteria bacterium CG10_big_fil_rev_8_21_14_0_10_36_16]
MKSGFAVLIGRSNVGKSTLMNTIVGTKIAATSFRAQMTRQVIHGVVNDPEGQIVFVDTPGIFKDKKNRLTGKLIEKAKEALAGVDIILYVVDPSREIGDEEKYTYGLIRHLDIPKILVINKSDLHQDEKKHLQSYLEWGQDFAGVFELSALRASHIQPLVKKVVELIPEGELIYENAQLTNITDVFWIAEIIREKVFSVFDKEVPYSITVEVDNLEEKPDIFVISARILTDAERYKKMIIGKGGLKIKEIGQMARRELEQSLNKKVFLELEVEVDKHWVDRV